MFVTYSKARTLELVKKSISLFKVPNLIHFNIVRAFPITENTSNKIKKNFKNVNVAVRSSAADEDGCTNSAAGEYTSVLNIPSNNPEKITEAINTVIASYKKKRPLLLED